MTRTTTRRTLAGTTAGALALGLLTVAAAPAQAATGCATDCIGTVTRTLDPEKATLSFSTTTSARVEVVVTAHGFAGPTMSYASTGTSHVAATGALAQGKSYRYQVVATDAQGASWQETGYFTTPVRTVAIDWVSVVVVDDSDSSGEGEIGAAGQLEQPGASVCQWKALSPFPATGNTFRATSSSNTPITISDTANLSCSGVPASGMYVGIQMVDNDKDAWDDCTTGPGYPWAYFGHSVVGSNGSSECWDWSSGYTALTFPHASGETGSKSASVMVVTHEGTYAYTQPTFSAVGTATFTIATPAASLPATTTGPVTIPLTLDGSKNMTTGQMPRILATWATPSVPNQPLSSTLVRLRKPGGSWLQIQQASLATTSHEFIGLEAGATYEVVVTGRDSSGNEYARTAATALAQGAPGAPVGLVATPGEGSVGLSWQPGPANGSTVVGYRVRYRATGEPLLTVLEIAPETSRTATGLIGGTTYEFYVEAITTTEDVGDTAKVGATPLAPATPVPPVSDPAPNPSEPAPNPSEPAPNPSASGPAAAVPAPAPPQVLLGTGARKKDGRVRAVISGWSPQVASVVVAWCDTRVSGRACDPTSARKRGSTGPLAADGTLELKLTSKRASVFNGTATPASFGRIKARRADWIRIQVVTTWADGRVDRSAVAKVRL